MDMSKTRKGEIRNEQIGETVKVALIVKKIRKLLKMVRTCIM